jgi:non-ribosomal peptide synthetase component E (peptide arylation enzyme)
MTALWAACAWRAAFAQPGLWEDRPRNTALPAPAATHSDRAAVGDQGRVLSGLGGDVRAALNTAGRPE